MATVTKARLEDLKLNETLLGKVKAQIKERNQTIDMNVWIEEEQDCETIACIGGWLTLLSETNVNDKKYKGRGMSQIASSVLFSREIEELPGEALAPAIFHRIFWPVEFQEAYLSTIRDDCDFDEEETDRQFQARMNARVKVVCDVIDFYIANPQRLFSYYH